MDWFGLKKNEEFEIKEIRFITGDDFIAILDNSEINNFNFNNYYTSLEYIKSLNLEIEITFGLFLSEKISMIRRKMKNSFIKELNLENFIQILEGDNLEIYYEGSRSAEKFLGIEIRFKIKVIEKDEIVSGIYRLLTKKKKKYY